MATVTITDLLMLVAVLFICYGLYTTITKTEAFADIEELQKFSENTLASTRLVATDKNCSQASINQTHLDYVFTTPKFIR